MTKKVKKEGFIPLSKLAELFEIDLKEMRKVREEVDEVTIKYPHGLALKNFFKHIEKQERRNYERTTR